METPDKAALAALPRTRLAGLHLVWPASTPALALEVVEPMHVLSLRHLPGGGSAALATVLAEQGMPALAQPGRTSGVDPLFIWRSPNETLVLTAEALSAAALLAALRPTPGALACVLDLSHGTLVVKLQGTHVDALLSRLVDAQALPRDAGQASRVRLADIAALVWREAPDRVGLLVDRANDHYLARWLSYAADAA
jgi:heterotetrameric sarcosine oxidase gamma subunit